ncbi:hypothetical protein [Bradyrhizobium yuanmingense]|uniref:hypothetical protein n=1 Tax=Bradyrhizobium yuanmingense TaxID=108015 RepID=UPI0023B9193D|nr:hypothetical protein [Bradyrhizobium yuanmingense]MDF0583970.1 hypothetical protein [Bradyrhizobium yuanmingense]
MILMHATDPPARMMGAHFTEQRPRAPERTGQMPAFNPDKLPKLPERALNATRHVLRRSYASNPSRLE